MKRERKPPYEIELHGDFECWICEKPMYSGDFAWGTGRGGSCHVYCSLWCADSRSCPDCPHPKGQHENWGCVAPVVDLDGDEDACSCKTPR